MVKMLTNRRTKAPARFNGSQCQWSTNGQSSSWSFSNLKIGLRKPKKKKTTTQEWILFPSWIPSFFKSK